MSLGVHELENRPPRVKSRVVIVVALITAGTALGITELTTDSHTLTTTTTSTSVPRSLVVPSVTGRLLATAIDTLRFLGLPYEVHIQTDPKVASGTVIGQNPIAGARTDTSFGVTLIVSAGPGTASGA